MNSKDTAASLRIIERYEQEAKLAPRDRVGTPSSDDSIETLGELAVLYRSFLPFCLKVEDIVNEDEPILRGDYSGELVVVRPTTSAALRNLGFEDLPICITEQHLWQIMQPADVRHHHGIDIAVAKRLPWLLERPALVAAHPQLPDDRALVVLPEVNDQGHPLLMPIKVAADGFTLDLEGITTNLILTLFGPKHFFNYFGAAITADSVCFIDPAQEKRLSQKTGVDVFQGLSEVPRGRIVNDLPCCAPQTEGLDRYSEPAAEKKPVDLGELGL